MLSHVGRRRRACCCGCYDIQSLLWSHFRWANQPYLLSICTGILGIVEILQFDELDFFLVWKQTGYFYQFKLDFFSSFWARVKYFDGPCLTIYSLFTIYRDINTSFWSGGFTTPTTVNQRNGNLKNSIFVHFELTFLTTLTGILDFANLIFQTGIFFLVWKQTGYFYQFKLYFSPSF